MNSWHPDFLERASEDDLIAEWMKTTGDQLRILVDRKLTTEQADRGYRNLEWKIDLIRSALNLRFPDRD